MIAVAGDRTRVTGGTGGITHHYTTTTAQNREGRRCRSKPFGSVPWQGTILPLDQWCNNKY
jgi:hypothetical protein